MSIQRKYELRERLPLQSDRKASGVVLFRPIRSEKMDRTINVDYWNKDYYDYWDEFVANWFKLRPNEPQDEISRAFKQAVANLEFDELPTPFLGNPRDGVDAVILSMNPGLSDTIGFGPLAGENADRTQYFCNIDNPDSGWLIRKFRDEANGLYSKFVGIDSDINFSCLNPGLLDTYNFPQWVCGVNWWQGYDKSLIDKKFRIKCRHRNQRMPWIRQIYGKNKDGREICPSKVFALELCPYHSPSFSFNTKNEVILNHIKEHVIVPAATAVVENQLPFAIAVGRVTANILDLGIGICRKEWSYKFPIEGWPLNDGLQRTYRLYDVKAQDGQLAHVVVTWAVRNRGIPAPGVNFATVEKLIHGFAISRDQPSRKLVRIVSKPKSRADINTCQYPNNKNGQLLSALNTFSRFMGMAPDMHNCQFLLWQNEGAKLFLRFTKNRPHVTFNFSVADKQAFVDQYGEILRTWGEAQGFRVFWGKEHSAGNGLQFKPIRSIDLDRVKCHELQEWSDMIIAKANEILK